MKQALRRRGISLLLSVCIMLSLLPLSTIPTAAADGYISTPWVEQIAAQLAEEGYGETPRVYPIAGSDLAYLLYTRMEDDEDGNPVMEGAGIFVRQTEEGGNYRIPDYGGTSEQPWGKANLKQIYIADGITGVGDYAFSSIVTLEKLEFENSSALTEVGRYAFASNRGLKSDGFDLSGVTALGEYAFTGCGGLAGVTLGDRLSAIEMRDGREVVTPNRIPNHVFSGAGLKSVNIPETVTEIGDYAFASCPLDEMETIALPEGLTEIGNYAFYRAVTSANQSVRELTIPASVTSIGAYAFYNYQGLSVVTVEEGSLLNAVGDAAFGTDANSAYHTVGDIVDSSGTLKFEDVPIGADFRLPQEIAEKKLFRNGETCYTGFVSPLVYLRTDEPTCTESGRHYYSLTYGETTIEVTRSIPPLGHAWSEPDYVGNSCERDGYWFRKCSRCELVEEVEGETDPATGHLWKIDEVKHPVIADGAATVFIYKCENKWHDNDRDETDSPVSFEITGKTLAADTTETLADLTQELRALSSNGLFTWNLLEEQLSQPLNFGTHEIPVSFKLNYMGITSDPVAADPVTGTELKVTVDVAKTPLDLSGVIFENWRGYVGETERPVNVTGLPAEAKDPVVEYYVDGGSWTTEVPEWTEENVPKGMQVRVTFSYADDRYRLDESHYPPAGYTVRDNGDGTATITHEYQVSMRTISATATPLEPVYNGGAQNIVRLSNLPESCTITYTVRDGEPQTVENGSKTTLDIVPQTDAGEYPLTILIHKENYVEQSIELTARVKKQPVRRPRANTQLKYLPGEVQTGVENTEPELYELTGNTGTDAKLYSATATLKYPGNYRWDNEGESGNGTAEIPWSIARRQIPKPNLNFTVAQTYTGAAYEAVRDNTGADYEVRYAADGSTLEVYFVGETGGYEELAYTVTDAKRTDAGTYTPLATLNQNKNYIWTDQTQEAYQMSPWTINRAALVLPEIVVQSAEYTGESFDERKISVTIPGEYEGILSVRGYEYYDTNYQSKQTPVNAGNYGLRVVYDYPERNYNLIGSTDKQFSIDPKTLVLTGTERTVGYDGLEHTVENPAVPVFPGDEDSYTYTYTTFGSEGEVVTHPDSPGYTAAGSYQVQVGINSRNYRAEPVLCKLTIGNGAHSVTLKSTDPGWNAEDRTLTKPLGSGAATVEGTGVLSSDGGELPSGAEVSYAVTEGDCVTVDAKTGELVTHRVGTAAVTVTAHGDAAGNYGAAVETYTVTVTKGTPVIEAGDLNFTYDGSPLVPADYERAAVKSPDKNAAAPETAGDSAPKYTFYPTREQAEREEGAVGAPTGQGDYFLRIDYPGDRNYNPVYKIVKVTIAAAELGVEASDYRKTYDGASHPLASQLTVTGVDGEPLSPADYTLVFVKSETKPTGWTEGRTEFRDVADSGLYWYRVTAPNYGETVGSLRVTVERAELTITHNLTVTEKVYDGGTEPSGENPALAAVVSGAQGGEQITAAASAAYNSKDVATADRIELFYTLNLNGASAGNYSYGGSALPEDGEVTGVIRDASITPLPVEVTGVTAKDRVYDGTLRVELDYSGMTTGSPLFNGDRSVTLAPSEACYGTLKDANAAPSKTVTIAKEAFQIAGSGPERENYTIASVTDAAVSIARRPAALQFPGGETELSAEYRPDGLQREVYEVSFAPGALVDDGVTLAPEDIKYSFTRDGVPAGEPPVDVGLYDLRAELTAEAAQKFVNYDVSPAAGTVEILRATSALKVEVTGRGALPYSGGGQDPVASVTVTGGGTPLPEGADGYTIRYGLAEDEVTLTRAELQRRIRDAQKYEIFWEVTTTNYGDRSGSFEFTVDPAELTVSSDLTEKRPYDGTAVAAVSGAELSGVQGGEEIALSGAVTAAYDSASAGTGKTITTTYQIKFGAGVSPANYRYGGAGTALDTDTGLWTIRERTQNGEITPAELTVRIDDQQAVYSGAVPALDGAAWEVTSGSVFGSDDLKVVLSLPEDAVDADSYAITGRSENGNYEVTFRSGTFTIRPRPTDVAIGSAEGYYGEQPELGAVKLTYQPTGTDEGLAPGETEIEGITLKTDASAGSAAGGSYTITGEETDGNYEVTFTRTGTYTVKQRPVTVTVKEHSSKYGAAIDSGLAAPAEGTDYTVAFSDGAEGLTGSPVVPGDDLGLALMTEATPESAVGSYPITPSAAAPNYEITFVDGSYRIEQAAFTAQFTNADQVQNGISIKYSETYDQNPLRLTNTANGAAVSEADRAALEITYSVSDRVGTGVAEIDPATGVLTLHSTGTVRVKVEVRARADANYTGSAGSWYDLVIIGGSGVNLQVTPKNSVYTGQPQPLVELNWVEPAQAVVEYRLEGGEWSQEIPTGTDAGSYTVYYRASADNYDPTEGWVTAGIERAKLPGFRAERVQVEYADGKLFDGAAENPLQLPDSYTGGNGITYYSSNSSVAEVTDSGVHQLLLKRDGSTVVTAFCPEDANYESGRFTYTLQVNPAGTTVDYEVEPVDRTYDGEAHGIDLTVHTPGATVTYSATDGADYTLTDPPAFVDAREEPYTVYFRIDAPGYAAVEDTGTVTIRPKELALCEVSGIGNEYTYTGSPIDGDDMEISVHDGPTLLTPGKDYEVRYENNTAVTGEGEPARVILTGFGNYAGSVERTFEILPIDASSLTAALDRTYGFFGDGATDSATVTVRHGGHEVVSSGGDRVTVTVPGADAADVTVSERTVQFHRVGLYTVHVKVEGNHSGEFDLDYALLPAQNPDGLRLTAGGAAAQMTTYGETFPEEAREILVTDSSGKPLAAEEYTLRYRYTPFEGQAAEGTYAPDLFDGVPAAGMYEVTATGTGGYEGSTGTFVFLVQRRNLSEVRFAAGGDYVYNGAEQKPEEITGSFGEITLQKGVDYTVAGYRDNKNAGEGQILLAAAGNNFTGSGSAVFRIGRRPITGCEIAEIPEQIITAGGEARPAVTVTDPDLGATLTGGDYEVRYENNTAAGEATAVITGIGNYEGEVEKPFRITIRNTRFDLIVERTGWIWDGRANAGAIRVETGDGEPLTLGEDYTLSISKDGEKKDYPSEAEAIAAMVEPGVYTVTATGTGEGSYSSDMTDSETVTITKITPELTLTANPTSLTGSGTVTLTLSAERLPEGTEFTELSYTKNGADQTALQLTRQSDGSYQAVFRAPNANATYLFAISYPGDAHHEAASAAVTVVTAKKTTIGGGGGGGGGGTTTDPDPEPEPEILTHLPYVGGYGDGSFRPEGKITRAEAAAIFARLLAGGEDIPEAEAVFADVPEHAWYAGYVNYLARYEIILGRDDGLFDPEAPITRAEFVTICTRFDTYVAVETVNDFEDVSASHWAYPYINYAVYKKWIGGYPDGTFRPDESITRAEAVQVTNRMLERSPDKSYIDAHSELLHRFIDLAPEHWAYYEIMEAANRHNCTVEDGERWT